MGDCNELLVVCDDLLDDGVSAWRLAAVASARAAVRLDCLELAIREALVDLHLVVLRPHVGGRDSDRCHSSPGQRPFSWVCTLPMMSPMTDDDVRAAVLDWLDGELDLDALDEIEDLAFERMVPGAPSVADAVAHVLSTREQFTAEELHRELLDIANTVVVSSAVEQPAEQVSASTASILDMRPRLERRQRRARFIATAGRQFDTAHG